MNAYTEENVGAGIFLGDFRARITEALNAGDLNEAGRLLAEAADEADEIGKDEADERDLPDGWADAHDFDDGKRMTASPSALREMDDDEFLRALGARLAVVPIINMTRGGK